MTADVASWREGGGRAPPQQSPRDESTSGTGVSGGSGSPDSDTPIGGHAGPPLPPASGGMMQGQGGPMRGPPGPPGGPMGPGGPMMGPPFRMPPHFVSVDPAAIVMVFAVFVNIFSRL